MPIAASLVTSIVDARLGIDDEPVADAKLGEDMSRPAGIDLELSAQAANVYAQRARIVPKRAPNLLDERCMSHDTVAVARERLEDPVLERSQS